MQAATIPSRITAVVFAIGVLVATTAMWSLSGHSVAKTCVFLLAMLFGGSMYFLKARE
jgi:hypothetical protein